MAGVGSVLVAASPLGPGQQVLEIGAGGNEQADQEMADLVDGQRDQAGRGPGSGVFGGGGDGEEGMGEHREDGPSLPGGPGADLVLVEGGEFLAGLTSDQQPRAARRVGVGVGVGVKVGVGERDPGPVVVPLALGAGPRR